MPWLCRDVSTEERIYLGSYEVWRKKSSDTLAVERQTLHIMDGQRRIAMVETLTVDDSSPPEAPSTRIRYQLDDHLGTASLETDDEGAVISYEEYHPYGSTAWYADDGSLTSPKHYRYTGMERDDETGLQYHSARYYAPWLGRWESTDPLKMEDGTNQHRYSRCSPVVLQDRKGTAPPRPDESLQSVGDTTSVEVVPETSSLATDIESQSEVGPSVRRVGIDGPRSSYVIEIPEGDRGPAIADWANRAVRSPTETRFDREEGWLGTSFDATYRCNQFVAAAYREGGRVPLPKIDGRDPRVSDLADPKFNTGSLEWHSGMNFTPKAGDIAVWFDEGSETHHAAIVLDVWVEEVPFGDLRVGLTRPEVKFTAAYAGTAAPDPNLKIADSDYLNSNLKAQVVFRRWIPIEAQ